MATPAQSPVGDAANSLPTAKLPIMPLAILLIVTSLLTVLGVGAVVLYLARAGKLGTTSGVSPVMSKPEKKVLSHVVTLEPAVVNLIDADAHSYLRVGVTLRIEDEPVDKKAPKESESKGGKVPDDVLAPIRDVVLAVLGSQKAEELTAPEAKERLKRELKAAVSERVPETKVLDVYFTEFLVQR